MKNNQKIGSAHDAYVCGLTMKCLLVSPCGANGRHMIAFDNSVTLGF